MKIVLLLSSELKQYYVIKELSKTNNVLGIIFENKYTSGNRLRTVLKQTGSNPFKLCEILLKKFKNSGFESRDRKIIEKLFLVNGKPIQIDKFIKVLQVNDINESRAVSFVKSLGCELLVVFGTSLVKKEMALAAPKGIINVHTGLSPYYRGGQCAFWCLYNEEPEYIGVTIHWLSQGIDSGDIILQGRPKIEENDNLCSIECKLAFLAVELLKKAIKKIGDGIASEVRQEKTGKLYFSKQLTLDKRLELEERLAQGLLKRCILRFDQVYNKVRLVDD